VSSSVPDVAKVNSYITLERNGFIYMWHHAEDVEPYWEPPVIEEIASGEWKYGGSTEHIVNANIEVNIIDMNLIRVMSKLNSTSFNRFILY